MRKKRFSTCLLAAALVVSMLSTTLTGCMRELTEQQSTALMALQNAVTYYETSDSLSGWQDLVALAAANRADGIGVNWNALTLPQTPPAQILASPTEQAAPTPGAVTEEETTSPPAFAYIDVTPYPAAIISSIVKGEDYNELARSLLTGQNPENGAFSETNIVSHIWSMITLTAAVGTDGYAYDKAAEFLLTYQYSDGGFGYGPDSTASDINLTGIASVALAPYYQKHKKTEEMKALVSLYKDSQTEDGGYAGPDGENAASISAAIWGLTALDQKLPKTEEGKTPMDVLLTYQNEDGSFRLNQDGDHKAHGAATFQATTALCDVLNDVNSYVRLAEDAESYRIENISGPAITLGITFPWQAEVADVSAPLTVEEGSTALDALVFYGKLKVMEVSVSGKDEEARVTSIHDVEENDYVEGNVWTCQINGLTPEQNPALIPLQPGDTVTWQYAPAPAESDETIIE